MSDPIRLTIRGRGAETDAPTVEDLLGQISDWMAILRGVEEAIAEDGSTEIEWRVTGAGKSSPLAFELMPFPRRHGMNIEGRTGGVKEHVSRGLQLLRSRSERPSYFTDPVLEKAERLFQRLTNGLDLTTTDFGDGFPRVEIARDDARIRAANTLAVRAPKDKPYREIGSVEGALQPVERDGCGRPVLYVRLRLDGETVVCLARGDAENEAEPGGLAQGLRRSATAGRVRRRGNRPEHRDRARC
jgi:hypothetical protein